MKRHTISMLVNAAHVVVLFAGAFVLGNGGAKLIIRNSYGVWAGIGVFLAMSVLAIGWVAACAIWHSAVKEKL